MSLISLLLGIVEFKFARKANFSVGNYKNKRQWWSWGIFKTNSHGNSCNSVPNLNPSTILLSKFQNTREIKHTERECRYIEMWTLNTFKWWNKWSRKDKLLDDLFKKWGAPDGYNPSPNSIVIHEANYTKCKSGKQNYLSVNNFTQILTASTTRYSLIKILEHH